MNLCSGFSSQEKIVFAQYQLMIDKAVRDSNQFEEFNKVRDVIVTDLKNGKKNVEKYVVNYIKIIIKHPRVPNQTKFNALLLLKEVLKSNNRAIINWNATKLLKRLHSLAESKLGPNCLLQYDPKGDIKASAAFHHLLLECLGRWGPNFAAINGLYADKLNLLLKAKKLPVDPRYWDIPQDRNGLRSDKDELRAMLDVFKYERMKIIELLRQKGAKNLFDPDIKEEFRIYEEEKEKIDANKEVQALINSTYSNPTMEDKDLANEFQNELMMYDVLYENYHRINENDPTAKQDFFNNIQNTHNNLFVSQIDFKNPPGTIRPNPNGTNNQYDEQNFNQNRNLNDPYSSAFQNPGMTQPVNPSTISSNFNNQPNVNQTQKPILPPTVNNYDNYQNFNNYDQGKNTAKPGVYLSNTNNINVYESGDFDTYNPKKVENKQSSPNHENNTENDQNTLKRGDSNKPGNNQKIIPSTISINGKKFRENNLQQIPETDEFNNSLNLRDKDGVHSPTRPRGISSTKFNGSDYMINEFGSRKPFTFGSNARSGRQNDGLGKILETKSIEEDFQTNNPRNGINNDVGRYQSGLNSDLDRYGAKNPSSYRQYQTQPEQDQNINRRSNKYGIANIKTEGSHRRSRHDIGEEHSRNPFKSQHLNNSKDFYKSYFAGSTNYSESKSSNKNQQFRTEGMTFVNSMYNEIAHTLAKNVE